LPSNRFALLDRHDLVIEVAVRILHVVDGAMHRRDAREFSCTVRPAPDLVAARRGGTVVVERNAPSAVHRTGVAAIIAIAVDVVDLQRLPAVELLGQAPSVLAGRVRWSRPGDQIVGGREALTDGLLARVALRVDLLVVAEPRAATVQRERQKL